MTLGRASLALAIVAMLGAAVVSAQRSGGGVEATVQDDKGKPVEDAVLLLHAGPDLRPAPTSAAMDQVDKEFVPHVLPIPIGTAVNFPNRDNIKHHVYSFSAPKKFELQLYTGTPASPVVFDKPGLVVLGCNIHDWMVGYVYVLDTPYFAKTGADGKARLAAVSPGSYEAHVWHPRMRLAVEKTAQPLTVSAAEPGRLAWTLALKREFRRPRGPGRYDQPIN